jgi:hypothetical protein
LALAYSVGAGEKAKTARKVFFFEKKKQEAFVRFGFGFPWRLGPDS